MPQAGSVQRFTPTRVGKTAFSAVTGSHSPVHPHACGENHVLLRRGQTAVRFTPTRVGKTATWTMCWPLRTVHPHACGENGSGEGAGWGTTGSPPRVWGKPRPTHHRSPGLRFTPTRVGKTNGPVTLQEVSAVHPHACGENAGWRDGAGLRLRFTPTRVGKTVFQVSCQCASTVHPHACGENVS